MLTRVNGQCLYKLPSSSPPAAIVLLRTSSKRDETNSNTGLAARATADAISHG